MNKYIAFISLDTTHFDVVFPDFDGLVSQGDTYDDAVRMAHEALAGHVEVMREHGENIPEPKTLDQIKKSWWGWDDWKNTDYAVAVISLLPNDGARRYTLSMPASLMARIDSVARNRSAFLVSAAEYALDGKMGNIRRAAA